MHQRRFTRLLLLIAANLLFFLLYSCAGAVLQQPVAFAHAFVIGSDPVDGSTVATAPKVVRIFFDAPISPASEARVYTPDERLVDAGNSAIARANPRELDTPLLSSPSLPEGSYTLRWTALASIDGHTTQGVIGFNVGQSSAGLPGETILGPSTSNTLPQLDLLGILAVAWEWLVLVALTFWVGILIWEGFLLRGVERTANLLTSASKRAFPLQWLCLTGLLVGEVITLILRSTRLSQATGGGGISPAALIQVLGSTTYGYLWLLRVAFVLCSLGLLWWTTRRRDKVRSLRQGPRSASSFGRMRQRVIQEHSLLTSEPHAEEPVPPPADQRFQVIRLALAGLIILTLALSGDAAQLSQPHVSSSILDWLYLAARCIWLGGLAYLGYVLLPLLPMVEPDSNTEVLMTLLRRFQPLLFAAVGVLLVSGLFEAESSLSSVQQLLGDPYGRSLLIESLLIVVMILLSALAFVILRPKLARQAALLPVVHAELPARRARQSALDRTAHSLKRTFGIASCLGAAVLVCAALMTFYAPPIVFPAIDYTSSAQVPPAVTATPQTRQVGNLSITLQVLPGRVNAANTVSVTLKDTRNGRPVTDAQVQMLINMQVMDMGTARATLRRGNPAYSATFTPRTTFTMPGLWEIRLHIQSLHEDVQAATFSVNLGDR
jgi:putative copper export protein/methionine-rich copper-binding protein CopC